MTWEAILRVADRIQTMHPEDANKLRFIASNVQWMEGRINELVADEWAATRARVVPLRSKYVRERA